MHLSIIIPTLNEAENIALLLPFLKENLAGISHEIIVADAGSTDGTATVAQSAGATVMPCAEKSRAKQMNAGAEMAIGEVLYFLHADTFPPAKFAAHILQAIAEKGADCGCFRLQFDTDHWFLKANCYFTRFDVKYFRWGDQSLFIKRAVFESAGGFRHHLKIMEDQELVIRLRKLHRFIILPQSVVTSARKYRENGVVKLQLLFTALQTMYHLGVSQERILRIYKRFISDPKTT